MDKDELIQFLEKFTIDKKIIDQFLEGKEIIEKKGNIFLTNKEFESNQIFDNNMIFVNLTQFLPSTYLLKFIADNTNCIQVKGAKQAMNYTYGKSLGFDSTIKTILVNNKSYIVKCDNSIIGIARIDKSQKLPIINEMNIGEYLKEN